MTPPLPIKRIREYRVPSTIDYYNQNADQFFEDTVDVDMTPVYSQFLSHIPNGGHILDAGCGSGRDAKAFKDQGYRVSAFDASPELAKRAAEHTGDPVAVRTFKDVTEELRYDGIWACASLLHVPQQEMKETLAKLWGALKHGGALYFSFKNGSDEREHNGRRFTDSNEEQANAWLDKLTDVKSKHFWHTSDQRKDREDSWLNAVIIKEMRLITGGSENPFLPHLLKSISTASEIDIAVAFTKSTGLNLLLTDLELALTGSNEDTEGHAKPSGQLRFLTSDYLDITDPEALRRLMLLKDYGAQIRIYESKGSSFHLKAYIFSESTADGLGKGTAYIGSSNISQQALQDGQEWNYRVDYPGSSGYLEARTKFEELFAHPRSKELTDGWIEAYEARRIPPERALAPGSQEALPPPIPSDIQVEALEALKRTRAEGYRRGLVVLATGLGKTWLAAFDTHAMEARRVLFVAHREEILGQAAETFLRIRPHARVGFYTGKQRDSQVDILCASVQTLGRANHLQQFSPQHFDYIVVDEFHHAAAPSYHKLLQHFKPQFLLGLTATPDRTDQSSILSLCDDNLVFTRNLLDGINAKPQLLAPFHYFGIHDESVDYTDIPWRNGRFDPEQLSHKLATLSRARHILKEWVEKRQKRTLAFCASIRHAEFMAEQFRKHNIRAAAVHASSTVPRGDALRQLSEGQLDVIFSVDLFNEGVDLPSIDTVMMLRPTESRILFLQQLGRGLRIHPDKEHLVVLDFIGNHKGFLHKPQALMGKTMTHREIAEYGRRAKDHGLELPDGCFVNYDLELIKFMEALDGTGLEKEYESLRAALLRRPTLTELYRSGATMTQVRQQYGDWFSLVAEMKDLSPEQRGLLQTHRAFFQELERTAMSKSYKMVLLEAFQELDGWREPPKLTELAEQSWTVMQRRRTFLTDLPDRLAANESGLSSEWMDYWNRNPVNAWVGGNLQSNQRAFFRVVDGKFTPALTVAADSVTDFSNMVQELIDYRLASYQARASAPAAPVVPLLRTKKGNAELPFFPNLRIACGHFKTGTADSEEYRKVSPKLRRLDPARHFIAKASGNSMNGGKSPILDGDYLLLEHVQPTSAGSVTESVMAIERQDAAGDNQYLLRVIKKQPDGTYVLHANNPDYEDMVVTDELKEQLRTFARLKKVLSPIDMAIGQDFMREEIPPLFGEVFNSGNWQSGHVVFNEKKLHILLVTLNKQGKSQDHRYIDHWIDERTFHWQSQNKTTPESSRGKQIISHDALGIDIHLFVREQKLLNGKAAPFTYYGLVKYKSHTGSSPMSVCFSIEE